MDASLQQPVDGTTPDGVNRRTWEQHTDEFTSAGTWIDRGEERTVTALLRDGRPRRLLDVGIGAGRTAALLAPHVDEYVGVDYTAEMVDAARRAHPTLDLRVADARDLDLADDASFDAVVFSFNGLDALSHADRQIALDEFRRVLRPGGWLVFSTLNREGPAFGERPWEVGAADRHHTARSTARYVKHLPSNVARLRRTYAHWWRLRALTEDHGPWAMAPLAAHEFGLFTHYVTPAGAREELLPHGFDDVTLVDTSGDELDPAEPARRPVYFHVVARAV